MASTETKADAADQPVKDSPGSDMAGLEAGLDALETGGGPPRPPGPAPPRPLTSSRPRAPRRGGV
ncbi:hypothetical protein ACFV2U_05300, partial [Streptomyces sp. NPDC059697]